MRLDVINTKANLLNADKSNKKQNFTNFIGLWWYLFENFQQM